MLTVEVYRFKLLLWEEDHKKGEMQLVIEENITKVDNYGMDGFDFSNPSGFKLSVSAGSLYIQKVDGEEDRYDYPAFNFEIEPDDDLDVAYDIYLLEQPSNSGELVHVDRTELGSDRFPRYEGDDELLFNLSSFIVGKGLIDITDLKVRVNKVVKKIGDTSEQEVSQPEGET